MIELGPCEITCVIGPMASGKTHLINQWLQAGQNRYVRFDATGETCEDVGVEHIWENPSALWARLKENPYYFRLAYHPGSDLQEDFHYAMQCLWRIDIPKLLVCDEIHEICPVGKTPDFFRTGLRYARHALLGMIGASQRLADVDKLFTGGARRVILFRNDDARDVDAVRDRWGRDCAETFQQLRPLIYNDATKETKQKPQCIVIPRGGKPSVYDFGTESYLGAGTVGESSTEDGSEIPSKDQSDIPAEQPSGEQDGDNAE